MAASLDDANAANVMPRLLQAAAELIVTNGAKLIHPSG